nr:PREDICTED: ER membrane protein complex subunit 7 [Opisthocomus hoazin]
MMKYEFSQLPPDKTGYHLAISMSAFANSYEESVCAFACTGHLGASVAALVHWVLPVCLDWGLAQRLPTDGSFVVHDVPSGSYVVEVISPAHKFEPVRVDITSKGKMRARYVNYIKTSEVVRLPYPLQMKSSGPPSYFIKRESWGWTDFLMNPMVMMMVLPLLIFVLLPKVVNTSDPDMRREMEQSMNMLNSNHELPDVSEFMTRLFSSKSSSKSASSSSKAGKSSSGKRR